MRSISICIVVEIRGNSHEEVCVCLCVECVLECLCRVCSMVWTEEIRWVHPGASHVEIASSIDGWSSRHALIRDEDGAFCLKCDLESDSDVIYYKYIVDGEWKFDPLQDTECDENGYINNVALATRNKQCEVDMTTSDESLFPNIPLMSFNIRYSNARDDEVGQPWSVRRVLICNLLDIESPAILCTQEGRPHQIDDLVDLLRDRKLQYASVGVFPRSSQPNDETCSILFDKTRFRVLAFDYFTLSDTPCELGSRSWGNKLPRICSWVRFECLNVSTSFYVFNTHLDHESPCARLRGMELILERIMMRGHPEDPVFLTGDFNEPPDEKVVQLLSSLKIHGMHIIEPIIQHTQRRGTFHSFRGSAFLHIDYIWAFLPHHSRIFVREGRIVSTNGSHFTKETLLQSSGRVVVTYPSDHFPILADVRFIDEINQSEQTDEIYSIWDSIPELEEEDIDE